MINMAKIDIDDFAMYVFCNEYDKLSFIPDFKTRIDTTKQNFKETFLQRCNCENCISASNLILNLKWYDYE